jgi:hypothetical protein
MRSLEDTCHDHAGKIEAIIVADAGCRVASPIAQLQDRIARRVRPPTVGAAAQRSPPSSRRRQGRASSNSVIGSAAALDS